MLDVNKSYDAYGVDRQSDKALINVALSDCEGKLADVADDALDKIRDSLRIRVRSYLGDALGDV